jgi:hypothetical protein
MGSAIWSVGNDRIVMDDYDAITVAERAPRGRHPHASLPHFTTA